MAGKLELPFFHFRPHPRWRGLGSLQVSITERYVLLRVWQATKFSGERRLPACSCRQPAGNIPPCLHCDRNLVSASCRDLQASSLCSPENRALATEVLRVAHASRVLAMTSRHRGLPGKACFGVTPKPTRETRALPRRICSGRLTSFAFQTKTRSPRWTQTKSEFPLRRW